MMDLNITPKKMEAIVSILRSWVIDDTIEYDVCESKLQALHLDQEVIDWMMDKVNVSYCTNVEQHLMECIEDYYLYYEIEYGNDSSECGHDIYLSNNY
jgi:hypothetical protein